MQIMMMMLIMAMICMMLLMLLLLLMMMMNNDDEHGGDENDGDDDGDDDDEEEEERMLTFSIARPYTGSFECATFLLKCIAFMLHYICSSSSRASCCVHGRLHAINLHVFSNTRLKTKHASRIHACHSPSRLYSGGTRIQALVVDRLYVRLIIS